MRKSLNLQMCRTLLLAAAAASCGAATGEPRQVDLVSLLDNTGRSAYRDFQQAKFHRALFIAPGGAWGWKGEQADASSAAVAANKSCQKETEYPCLPYAIDDRVVFDAAAWGALLEPYQTLEQASKAAIGPLRGNRFYDLAMRNPSGAPMRLSDLRGKVVIVHFWGSWCPTCRRELPDLQRAYQAAKGSPDIQFVLLQARESFDAANDWARSQHLDLPLFDSTAQDMSSSRLPLASGGFIPDSSVAAAFPSTYILDKHGIVVFSHTGSLYGWSEYLSMVHNIAKKSGR